MYDLDEEYIIPEMSGAADAESAWIVMAVFGIFFIISIICWILQIVANWKIFTKMGEPGWKSIIPVLNSYTMYKRVWKGSYGILVVILPFFAGMMFGVAASIMRSGAAQAVQADFAHMNTVAVILVIVGMVLFTIAFVISIIGLLRLAKAFGKSTGFGVGLIFFTLIFLLVLAFGSDEYKGNPDELE